MANRTEDFPMPKPTHYKVVCISIYTRDLEDLDRKVVLLKHHEHHGWSKANRSHLLRIALARISDDELATLATEQRRRV